MNMPENPIIEYVSDDAVWGDVICERIVLNCVRALSRTFPHVDWPVCVRFSTDAAVAELNERYRQRAGPTNVLSFSPGDVTHEESYLGDIILAYETCDSEAQCAAITLEDHATHLLLHGTLHLLGFDHENDKDAARMEASETQLLATIGIKDPYREIVEKSS